jgi:transposase
MTFLSPEEHATLKVRHRLERDGRVRDRIKCILLFDKGWPPSKIAEALMIDDSTVHRHIEDYKENKKLHPENGGSTSKLDKEKTSQLIAHLESHIYPYTKDICAYVLETYGVHYTIPGMRSWLQAHKFSYKQPKAVPKKADPIKQAAFIKTYEDLLNSTDEGEPIEFGDGVHPTMATKVTRGWIRKGKDHPISTTASRTRMNLFGSINLETMEITIKEHETIDSKAMKEHFAMLRKKYPKARLIHLILDQGPYNKSAETQGYAKEYGIKIHYLPPYSPNLNPQERVWKVMNERVRDNVFFKSAKDFKNAIRDFFEEAWPQLAKEMEDRINDNFYVINPASST